MKYIAKIEVTLQASTQEEATMLATTLELSLRLNSIAEKVVLIEVFEWSKPATRRHRVDEV